MISIKQAVGSSKQATEKVASGSTKNATGIKMNKKTLMIIGGILAIGVVGYLIWKRSQSGSGGVLNVTDVPLAPATGVASDVPI
jgi:hypothetical protein